MQKIKYIIIFTLLLALALVYIEMVNYKEIANQLLNQNNSIENRYITKNKETIKLDKSLDEANTLNQNLKDENKILKQKIIDLEENLTNMICNTKIIEDINYTINTKPNYKLHIIEKNSTSSFDIPIVPSISIDQEKKEIDSLQIQYEQKF